MKEIPSVLFKKSHLIAFHEWNFLFSENVRFRSPCAFESSKRKIKSIDYHDISHSLLLYLRRAFAIQTKRLYLF